jgi:hypothetical protein
LLGGFELDPGLQKPSIFDKSLKWIGTNTN